MVAVYFNEKLKEEIRERNYTANRANFFIPFMVGLLKFVFATVVNDGLRSATKRGRRVKITSSNT